MPERTSIEHSDLIRCIHYGHYPMTILQAHLMNSYSLPGLSGTPKPGSSCWQKFATLPGCPRIDLYCWLRVIRLFFGQKFERANGGNRRSLILNSSKFKVWMAWLIDARTPSAKLVPRPASGMLAAKNLPRVRALPPTENASSCLRMP